VVSPLVAVNSSVTLLLSIFVLGDRPPIERLLVLLVILFGVGLASLQVQDLSRFFHQPGVQVRHGTGIRWALIAMLGLGVLNFGMATAATRTSAWFLVLFWTRLFSLFFLLLSQLLPPRTPEPPPLLKRSPRAAWPLAVAAGLTELAGLVLFSLDAQLSSTSVAAVLASANSLLPIFVGIAVFHERLTKSQGTGVAFVVLGVIELGAPGPVRDPLLFLTLAGAVAIVCLLLLPQETCKGASQPQTPAHLCRRTSGTESDTKPLLVSTRGTKAR
jgi:drug/metabolite transporter (DMT)-like permease